MGLGPGLGYAYGLSCCIACIQAKLCILKLYVHLGPVFLDLVTYAIIYSIPLQGCYVNYDEFNSRFKTLNNIYGPKDAP